MPEEDRVEGLNLFDNIYPIRPSITKSIVNAIETKVIKCCHIHDLPKSSRFLQKEDDQPIYTTVV